MVLTRTSRIRTLVAVLLCATLISGLGATQVATAPPAQAIPCIAVDPVTSLLCGGGVVDKIASAVASKVASGLKDLTGKVISGAATAAASAASAAVSAALNPAAQGLLDFWTAIAMAQMKWVMLTVGVMLSSVPPPDVAAQSYVKLWGTLLYMVMMLQGSAALMLMLLILVTRRWHLIRKLLVDLPLSTVFGLVALPIVQFLVITADWVTSNLGNTLWKGAISYANALANTAQISGAGPLGALISSGLIMAGGVGMYTLLMIRSQIVEFGTVLALVLLLARLFGGVMERLFSKVVYQVIAWILIQPLIIIMLAVGSAINTRIPGDSAQAAFGKAFVGSLVILVTVAVALFIVFSPGRIMALIEDFKAQAEIESNGEASTQFVDTPQSASNSSLIERARDSFLVNSPIVPVVAGATFGPEAAIGVAAIQEGAQGLLGQGSTNDASTAPAGVGESSSSSSWLGSPVIPAVTGAMFGPEAAAGVGMLQGATHAAPDDPPSRHSDPVGARSSEFTGGNPSPTELAPLSVSSNVTPPIVNLDVTVAAPQITVELPDSQVGVADKESFRSAAEVNVLDLAERHLRRLLEAA